MMFWGMAFVCEEYSIPSITVFCKRNNIPDDVAGAIYIGTGLSLPVLFVSFIGLFVSNTAIGVGTVIGGDLFNHLINIGISIWVAPNRTLKVNPLVVTREMICYLLSSLLIIWAVHEDFVESLQSAFDREQWLSCLNIPWVASFVLVTAYVIYVILEINFDKLWLIMQRNGRACCLKFGFTNLYQPAATNAPPSAGEYKDLYDVECNNNLTYSHFMNHHNDEESIPPMYASSSRNTSTKSALDFSDNIAATTTAGNETNNGNLHKREQNTTSFPAPKEGNVHWKINNNKSLLSVARSSFSSSQASSERGNSANSETGLIPEDNQSNNISNQNKISFSPPRHLGQGNYSKLSQQKTELDEDSLIEINFNENNNSNNYNSSQQSLPSLREACNSNINPSYLQLNAERLSSLAVLKPLSSIPEHLSLNNFILYIRISNPYVDCLPFNYKWKKRYCILNDYGLYYKSTDDITLPSLAHSTTTGISSNSSNEMNRHLSDSSNNNSSNSQLTPKANAMKYINLFKLGGYTIDNVDKFEFSVRINDEKSTYMYFRAPSEYIFNLILHKLDWFMKFIQQHNEMEISVYSSQAK
jgi:hypothetical protein